MKKINKSIVGVGLIGMVSLTIVAPSAYADTTVPVEQPWATNEYAAEQRNINHKEISDLAIADNELYSGYGDYGANIGPINIVSHNLDTSAATNHLTFQTEDIDTIRKMNGKLYMPNIDPKGGWDANQGYATNESGSWKEMEMTPFIHIFDIATTGNDIWLAGSIVNPNKDLYGPAEHLAAVKRSVDGGATWTIEKASSTENIGPQTLDRNYWLASINGKIYTQAETDDKAMSLDVWENGVWTTEDITFPLAIYKGSSVEVINDSIVFRSSGKIYTYNTVTKESKVNNLNVWDLYVDEETNTIYTIDTNSWSGTQKVYSSKDGFDWVEAAAIDVSNLPTAPFMIGNETYYSNTIMSALAVKGKDIYLGTTLGTIFKRDLTTPNPADGEPPVQAAAEITIPSDTITLKELSKPMTGVKAQAYNGQDITNLVTNKKKSNLKGTTVVYTLNYNGETFTKERKVLM